MTNFEIGIKIPNVLCNLQKLYGHVRKKLLTKIRDFFLGGGRGLVYEDYFREIYI